ncbi:DUF4132 domain-containing protein [Ectopseudomonas alcaliphila]|uniref:DUF4132 domain-containing protein n=1 Tax=Ectopseudomonas alcaliphila TaxID=101564 RepID=UPI00277F15DA|nr:MULTISPECIES: DUF4132 domain-containing protein [Pseudomonas]MDP9940536.1 hypothetical protein [Pseudomonas sp. 3400]MDR7011899.1 hypothetical protein [Pseudomonas alcaliphila]
MLQKLLEKIGLTSTTPFAKHATESLEVLDILAPGLAERAATYVLSGRQEEVLLELAKVGGEEAVMLLDQPATLGWWYPSSNIHNDLQKHRKRINAAANARARLYILSAETDLPALARFGKVLQAACHSANLVRIAKVPDWYIYLVVDALHTTLKNIGDKHSADMRRHWHMDLLIRLAAVDELPADDALLLVFDRRDLADYHRRDLASLLKLPGLSERLLAHPQTTRALPGRLSASGCLSLVDVLGHTPALAEAYADVLVHLAVNPAKSVRNTAVPQVETLPLPVKLTHLEQLLEHGSNSERVQAADMLARSGEAARPLLQARLQIESSKPVQQALGNALARLQSQSAAQQQELPDAPPFERCEEYELGEATLQLLRQNLRELLEENRIGAEEEIRQNREHKQKWDWRQRAYKNLQALDDNDLRNAVERLNGRGSRKEPAGLDSVLQYRGRLAASAEVNLLHVLRASSDKYFNWYRVSDWLRGEALQRLDLRTLEDALRRSGHGDAARATAAVCFGWNSPLEQLSPEKVWPFFAEHPEFLEEAFGLRPAPERSGYSQGTALTLLEQFPVLPARFIPVLLELALGGSKTHRLDAQRLLETLPDIADRAVEALASSKQEIRTLAAEWLQRLGKPETIPALKAALAKEKRETVRAALLTALESLGEDIGEHLTPAVLLAEAKKGLQAKAPSSLAWLDLERLPACQWQDGKPVAADILRWWVILACKLKEPAGNALLNRYLGLLAPASSSALGSFLLHAFIAQDTLNPSLEEAIAHAQSNLAQRMQSYKSWAKYSPEYADITEEQAFEALKKEHLGIYLGSAIADKGILALTWCAPGHQLVSLLQAFMRDHYMRRSQIEAMLGAAANSNEPLVIQLLLSVARRHRTASVQTRARELVEQIALRNGWSADELADRTIPSAGFDENGVLALQYGERLFSARLDAALKLELLNPDGKVVKALPEPRKSDDPALIKEAKTLFSTSKKELKQVVELQTQRLYEAMCAARAWPVGEWREYLLQHPIMRHLLQRLVWAEIASDGQERLFRPTEDGSLIDLDDDELDLADDSRIRLAHAALVDDGAAKGWVRHFKDYKIKPLFPQMIRQLPTLASDDCKDNAIHDRQGWLSDTFTLRGILTKLGYQRAAAEDGGFFDHYFKDFSSLGLRVCIGFTGNCVPEENVPAALTRLWYEKPGRRWSSSEALPLPDIAPILLAETYADYHSVADACSGFDPEWEKKTPW